MLASHSVVIAKASGGTPTWLATVTATGVSSTAVVSRLSRMALAQASTTMAAQHHDPPSSDLGREVRGLVEDAGQAQISATTVMAMRKVSTGRTRSARIARSVTVQPSRPRPGCLPATGAAAPARRASTGGPAGAEP